MDGLLRGQKQAEIMESPNGAVVYGDIGNETPESLFAKAYDLSSNVVLFPVRHHSPACSRHLLKVIERYEPEAILIEGPENAQALIPFAASEKTKAPFCMYLSYDDKDGKISEEKDKYRAYYPFLNYSPELVALREGRKRNIECRFIDLSYGEKLLNCPKSTQEDMQGTSDSIFLLSDYYKTLTERLGCKNFSELWEMLFEIDGAHIETDEFVKNVFYYCYYSRMYTSRDDLLFHGDKAREYAMLENIQKACKEFQRVLVVTGGIHTVALASMVQAENVEKMSLIRSKKEDSPSYLMPYSFEASDREHGYESGMIFPYFYEKVWENIQKNRKKPFEETVLRFIINTAGQIRKKQALSIADEIQSFYMAKGLGELRGKRECGVFEAIDAVKSSFVKGEIHSLYQPALKTLYRLMTGMEMGSVDPDAGVPPIVNDFLEQCKRHKISTNSSLRKETRLDSSNNVQHREKSYFFHQMEFLGTDFCHCLKDEDSQTSGSRILLRQTWEYRFSPGVQVALISVSAFGGTVRAAALTMLSKKVMEGHSNTRILSELLIRSDKMGLTEIYKVLLERLTDIVAEDMDFFSVIDGFRNLCAIKDNSEMLEEGGAAVMGLITLCLNRIMTLLYTIIQVKRENEDKACEGIKFLYGYFINNEEPELEDLFLQNMASIYNDPSANGALSGASAGALYKKEKLALADIMTIFHACLDGPSEAKKLSASFLKGFFKIAKDAVFVSDELLLSIDSVLRETTGDLFLEILPDLRLAFTDFMVFETDKIAQQVASYYQVSGESLLYRKALNQKDMELAAATDVQVEQIMKEWLLP